MPARTCLPLPRRIGDVGFGPHEIPRSPRVAEDTGGVAPVGHPKPIRTIVDTQLAAWDVVWAAGGHPHYVFPTSFTELLHMTNGTPFDVGVK